jgi:hypothetical protein
MRTKREHFDQAVNSEQPMPESAAPNPQADADRLEAAADKAIAACDGDIRAALKALIVANEFLEAELRTSVSTGYVRGCRHGRFRTNTG